ncbi:MAG: hypothetical protein JW841_18060 [Deltaproteobacteria bacterium]|nr:hypothetical protein [Deltaproteobacteria bacterium]
MNKALKPCLLFIFLTFVVSSVAHAQLPERKFGLGLYFGDPAFGFTGRYWFNNTDAVQAVLGWTGTYYGASGPIFIADWQHQMGHIDARTQVVSFDFTAGVGGAAGYIHDGGCYRDRFNRRYCYDDNAGIIFRVPVTFTAFFPKPRVEAYVDLVPSIILLPRLGPSLMGGIGGRYYF